MTGVYRYSEHVLFHARLVFWLPYCLSFNAIITNNTVKIRMFRIRDRSRLEVAFSLPFNNNCFSQCCLSSLNFKIWLLRRLAFVWPLRAFWLINISLECSWAGYDSNDTERKLGHKNMIYGNLKHLTKQAYFIRVTTAILPIWPKNLWEQNNS